MGSRNRFHITQDVAQGAGNPINIDTELPNNCELIQYQLTLGVAALTAEDFVLRKESVLGTPYDVDIFVIDPNELGGVDYLCHKTWDFRKGDTVTVDYPNTDDEDVAVELVFRESTP